MIKLIKLLKKSWPEMVIFAIAFLFSWWLMWHTFWYKEGTIHLALKIWSDFAANLPLIRSFSFGNNFPPEYPLFPSEPIKYHFLFYLLVGLLERVGLRLDWALNLPSVFSFFGLLVVIYGLAYLLFKSRLVAFLSTIFFLFNGTFSFLEFFKTHPFSLSVLTQIYHLKEYVSFMPYGPGEVTAFWSLNTFINQRHLALAFSLLLLMVYLLVKELTKNKDEPKLPPLTTVLHRTVVNPLLYFSGFVLGLFLFLHKAVFLMAFMILVMFFLLFKKLRLLVLFIFLVSLIFTLPQLFLSNQFSSATSNLAFYPGYLVHGQPLTAFIRHWFLNLGFHTIFIPLGFLLAPRQAKKVFLAFLSLFFIGNLFKFSPEIAVNHKFFNLFIIVGNMASAYFIYRIWQKRIVGKILAFILFFPLILSGIIDFFPIKNDVIAEINDYPKNPDIAWIMKHTPPNSLFLNSSYLYHPASLAGRKIFLGWPYFVWSAGYQTEKRKQILIEIFRTYDKETACFLLKENRINYIALEKNISLEEAKEANLDFWQNNFVPVYKNKENGLKIYQVSTNCWEKGNPWNNLR